MHMCMGLIVSDLESIDDVLYKYYETSDEDHPYVEFFEDEDREDLKNNFLSYRNELMTLRDLNIYGSKVLDLYLRNIEDVITFESYVNNHLYLSTNYTEDENGNIVKQYGYYSNPHAIYDYYIIGGRWDGMLLVDEEVSSSNIIESSTRGEDNLKKIIKENKLQAVNAALIKDINFERMEKVFLEYHKSNWNEDYLLFYKNKDEALKGYSEFSIYGLILEDEFDPYYIESKYESNSISKEKMFNILEENKDKYLVIIDMHY